MKLYISHILTVLAFLPEREEKPYKVSFGPKKAGTPAAAASGRLAARSRGKLQLLAVGACSEAHGVAHVEAFLGRGEATVGYRWLGEGPSRAGVPRVRWLEERVAAWQRRSTRAAVLSEVFQRRKSHPCIR